MIGYWHSFSELIVENTVFLIKSRTLALKITEHKIEIHCLALFLNNLLVFLRVVFKNFIVI